MWMSSALNKHALRTRERTIRGLYLAELYWYISFNMILKMFLSYTVNLTDLQQARGYLNGPLRAEYGDVMEIMEVLL